MNKNWQNLLKYLEFKNNFKPTLVKKISRIKVHNTLAFPTLFHGREIWTLRKKDKKRLTSIEMKFFRTVGYILFNHKRNEESSEELKVKPVDEKYDTNHIGYDN